MNFPENYFECYSKQTFGPFISMHNNLFGYYMQQRERLDPIRFFNCMTPIQSIKSLFFLYLYSSAYCVTGSSNIQYCKKKMKLFMYLFLINSDNMIIEVLLLALLIRKLLSICNESNSTMEGQSSLDEWQKKILRKGKKKKRRDSFI